MMKTRLKKLLILWVFIGAATSAYGQSENRNWELTGYIKDLRGLYFVDGLDSILIDNLLHNRLNFKWYPNEYLTVYTEIRNRAFYGDFVKAIPNYGLFPDVNNDFFDLSFNLINQNAFVFNSTIDRFYVEWNKDDWEVRVGRQRINWGINLAWNPNDIFNAYSFFDFDYEERPGSDAIRIKKYTGIASSVELASNIADDIDHWVVAGLWNLNKWDYDFQVLAGKAGKDWALGTGWAGNIKKAGFKGEVTWFKPLDEAESFETLLISVSADYSFPNTLYLNGSFLINTNIESDEEVFLPGNFSFERLGAKRALPYKYAAFLQTGFSFNPLVVGSLSLMTFPGEKTLFINPSLSASVFQNFDIDIISQLFYKDQQGEFKALSKALFLRMKWSF